MADCRELPNDQHLPPNVAVTYQWAHRIDSDQSDAVVRALYQHTFDPASWLDGLMSNVPQLFVDDATGCSFALLAEFADAFGHRSTSWAFQRAAQPSHAVPVRIHLLARAALAEYRERGQSEAGNDLLDVAAELNPWSDPILSLFQTAAQDDYDGVITRGLMVGSALGLQVSAQLPAWWLMQKPKSKTNSSPNFSNTAISWRVSSLEFFDSTRRTVVMLVANALRGLNSPGCCTAGL